MLLQIHHAQITVPMGAEADARGFYCEFLGLKEIARPEILRGRGGFWVGLGEQQIHIGYEDGIDRLKTKAHLAYLVSDLGYWRERLEYREIDVLDGIPIPGYDRIEFRDPFGNRIEFLQSKSV